MHQLEEMVNSLEMDFHDSELEEFRLGPRRELVLSLRVDMARRLVQIRLASIENFTETEAFLGRLPRPSGDGYWDRLEQLEERRESGGFSYLLHFAEAGALVVRCGKALTWA